MSQPPSLTGSGVRNLFYLTPFCKAKKAKHFSGFAFVNHLCSFNDLLSAVLIPTYQLRCNSAAPDYLNSSCNKLPRHLMLDTGIAPPQRNARCS
jgi:hypothetical protein